MMKQIRAIYPNEAENLYNLRALFFVFALLALNFALGIPLCFIGYSWHSTGAIQVVN